MDPFLCLFVFYKYNRHHIHSKNLHLKHSKIENINKTVYCVFVYIISNPRTA